MATKIKKFGSLTINKFKSVPKPTFTSTVSYTELFELNIPTKAHGTYERHGTRSATGQRCLDLPPKTPASLLSARRPSVYPTTPRSHLHLPPGARTAPGDQTRAASNRPHEDGKQHRHGPRHGPAQKTVSPHRSTVGPATEAEEATRGETKPAHDKRTTRRGATRTANKTNDAYTSTCHDPRQGPRHGTRDTANLDRCHGKKCERATTRDRGAPLRKGKVATKPRSRHDPRQGLRQGKHDPRQGPRDQSVKHTSLDKGRAAVSRVGPTREADE